MPVAWCRGEGLSPHDGDTKEVNTSVESSASETEVTVPLRTSRKLVCSFGPSELLVHHWPSRPTAAILDEELSDNVHKRLARSQKASALWGESLE